MHLGGKDELIKFWGQKVKVTARPEMVRKALWEIWRSWFPPSRSQTIFPAKATHLRVCQVQSGMSGSPVAVRAGASLLGKWFLPRVPTAFGAHAVIWCSDLHGAPNTQQLWRQNFCSHWTALQCGTLFLSSCAIQTSPTDSSDDSWRDTFASSMKTALCDFWYAAP